MICWFCNNEINILKENNIGIVFNCINHNNHKLFYYTCKYYNNLNDYICYFCIVNDNISIMYSLDNNKFYYNKKELKFPPYWIFQQPIEDSVKKISKLLIIT